MWIIENLGTIVVGLLVFAAAVAAFRSVKTDFSSGGCSSCGGNCSCCHSRQQAHQSQANQ